MIKNILYNSLVTAFSTSFLLGADGWMSDFEAAKKKAADENKSLLVDFTGSDWCGWCIRLRKEVFEHDTFADGVADKFVLVELDYPRDKSNLSEELIAQNNELKEEYSIRGYPTIYLMDAEGIPYAKTGYQEGGPETYVASLDEMLKLKTARDDAFSKAESAEGFTKAEILVEAVKALPEETHQFYQDVLAELKTLDPEDSLGFQLIQRRKSAFAALQKLPRKAVQDTKFDEHKKTVADFVEEFSPEGEELQTVKSVLLQIGGMARDDEDTLTALADEIIALNPDTGAGRGAARFKKRLAAKKAEKSESAEAK